MFATMSDWSSVNKTFIEELGKHKRDSSESDNNSSDLIYLYCNVHFLLGLSHKCESTLKEQPNSQILIIGDSNLSNITTSPNDHVNIESFPGAKIAHITQLLTKLENQPSTEPECVILSIGINDRE